MTAFGRSGLVLDIESGHRQGYEEGIGGRSDHFRHLGLHTEPQAQVQVALDGLAVFVGLVHYDGIARGSYIGFQSILNGGSVLIKSSPQSVVQNIGLIVPVVVTLVGIGVATGAVGKTDCCQQVSSLLLVEAIQNLSQIVIGMLIVDTFGEGNDVGNTDDGKLNTLQRVAVGILSITQRIVGIAVGIAFANSFAQDFFHIAFAPTGGDKGSFVPGIILVGIGPIVLPDS